VYTAPQFSAESASEVKLERRQIESVVVIGPVERVEIGVRNCDEFKVGFTRLLQQEDRNVVLDASSVEFFDSAGMGSLLSLQKNIDQRGGQFVLAGMNRSVFEVFKMVGFDAIFKTFPDVDQAVRSFEP